jgi:hypothetical protein
MGNRGGGSPNSGGGRDTKTPFGKASSSKTKTKFGYSKPKNKVVEFAKGGGAVGAFVDHMKKGAASDKKKRKEAKVNDSLIGTPDYQGDVKAPPTIKEVLDEQAKKDQRDKDPNPTTKSKEQPKVKSQMDNTDVKSKEIIADKISPTTVELSEEEKLLRRKRGRKTKTVLTSVTGDNTKATLSKKTLLGI